MSKQDYRESQRLKPIGVEGIEACREVLRTRSYRKVNEVMVDLFTASAIVGVFDKLNDKNKDKLVSFPMGKVANIVFKLI
jgi:hypothetical protein